MYLPRTLTRIENKIFLIIALTTLISSLTVFYIIYNMLYGLMIDDLRKRTENANFYAQRWLPEESFTQLQTPKDEQKSIYQESQNLLDRIRELANVRYLFTAKRDPTGKVIYLIDGLYGESEDFRHIGDPVEDEILNELNTCLSGTKVGNNTILNTSWGAILITCWPKFDAAGKVVGAIVMEYDADALQQRNFKTLLYSVGIALGFSILFITAASFYLRKLSVNFYKDLAFTDVLTGLKSRTAYERRLDMLKQQELEVVLVMYDLNCLKFINDTFGHAAGDAYIRKMGDCMRTLDFENIQHYRIGGDEFVSIVCGVGIDTVEEEVAKLFAATRTPVKDEHFFEFSYGIASHRQTLDKSVQDTLSRADSAMYAFKRKIKAES